MKLRTIYTTIILLNISLMLWAQNETLAKQYFKEGQYDKAEVLYKELFDKSYFNLTYLDQYISTLQAQEKYNVAQSVLKKSLNKKRNIPPKYIGYTQVLLGNNFWIQNDTVNANKWFDKALETLKSKPNQGYQIAKKLHEVQQLNYALESYQFIIAHSKSANYHYQIAIIYGEMGDTEAMFKAFLDVISKNKKLFGNVKRHLNQYISNDNLNQNNILLRQVLVQRIQQHPALEWYQLLSWLYLLQKDYQKALLQEKSLYMQQLEGLLGVKSVGLVAYDAKEFSSTIDAFNFVLNETNNIEEQLEAHYYILESTKKAEQDLESIQRQYDDVFVKFPASHLTINLLISYANFLTFYKNLPQEGIKVLEEASALTKEPFVLANIKLQLADILVFTGKNNRALILYTQIQNSIKDNPIGQLARFKVAQTSYFKGDFNWANTQLNVLKRSTSKLIANDAIDLSLLISTNQAKDSTDIALKQYAKAEMLSYQHKNKQAIDTLNSILEHYKEHPILDNTIYKLAEMYENEKNYKKAIELYKKLLTLKQDNILFDDATYKIAKIYEQNLLELEEAQKYYEKVIMNYPSSIYLVDARKRFRALRKGKNKT